MDWFGFQNQGTQRAGERPRDANLQWQQQGHMYWTQRAPERQAGATQYQRPPDAAGSPIAVRPAVDQQEDDGWFGEKKLWRELFDKPKSNGGMSWSERRQPSEDRPPSLTGTGLTTWIQDAVCCVQNTGARGIGRTRTMEPQFSKISVNPLQVDPATGREQLHGVGIIFRSEESGLVVAGLCSGSPAAETGAIHPGMILAGINGVNVQDLDPSQIARVILGPPGSPVQLRFKHPQNGQIYVVQTRREFSIPDRQDEGFHSDGEREDRSQGGSFHSGENRSQRSHSPGARRPFERTESAGSRRRRRDDREPRRDRRDASQRDRRGRDDDRRYDDRRYDDRRDPYYDSRRKHDSRERPVRRTASQSSRRDRDRGSIEDEAGIYDPPPAYNPSVRPPGARRDFSRTPSRTPSGSRTPSPEQLVASGSRDPTPRNGGPPDPRLFSQYGQFQTTASASSDGPSLPSVVPVGTGVGAARRELAPIPSLSHEDTAQLAAAAGVLRSPDANAPDPQVLGQGPQLPSAAPGLGGVGQGSAGMPPSAVLPAPVATEQKVPQRVPSYTRIVNEGLPEPPPPRKSYQQLLAELKDDSDSPI